MTQLKPKDITETDVYIRLLEPSYISYQNERIEYPITKPVLLIMYLAYQQNWLSRDVLATFVRPDTDTATARQTLRQHLARARKFKWVSESLEVEKSRIRWQVASDVQDFRNAIGKADWANAVACYSGPLLAGLASQESPTFDAWLIAERASLHNAWRKAARKHAEDLSNGGHQEDAALLYKKLWQDDPLAEDSLQAYIRASYLAGQRDEALEAFDSFATMLKDELELTPLEDTQQLIATIRCAEQLNPEVTQTQKVDIPLSLLRPPVLVGREVEQQAIVDSKTPVTLVYGEAGTGKSRLLNSIFPDALYLKCLEGLEHVPYYPIVAYIRKNLANIDSWPALASFKTDLARLIPELGSDDLLEGEELDNETAKSRLLEALAIVLSSQADKLIIDDLQWADAATFELLHFLANKNTETIVKLYGAYRDNEVGLKLETFLEGMRSGKMVTLVEVGGLEPSSLTSLMATIMQVPLEQGPVQFSQWLFDKSGGNPFFALETLKTLLETRSLSITDGIWQSDLDSLSQNYDELALPPAVLQMVERRIKTLSDETRRVLSVACVMQTGFNATVLSKISALSEWATSEALAEAESKDIIDIDCFKHDLTRQALYSSLPESQRRFIHKSIADVLSSSLTSVLSPKANSKDYTLKDPLIIAEHYLQAKDYEQAAKLLFTTANIRYEQQVGFETEAIELYQRVIALDIDNVYCERAKAYLAGRLIAKREFDKAEQLIQDVLNQSQDAIARCCAYVQYCTITYMQGSIGDAAKHVENAFALLDDIDEEALTKDVILAQAVIAQNKGEFERSIEIVLPLIKANEKMPLTPNHLNPLNILAANYADLGHFEKALEMYYKQLDIVQKFNRKEVEIRVIADILSTLDDMGRVTEGIALGEHALTLGDSASTPPIYYNLGLAYYELKQIDDALKQVELTLKTAFSVNILALTYSLKADIHSFQNKTKDAHKAVAEGLEAIKETDRLSAQAIMVIAAYKFGSSEQQKDVQHYIDSIDIKNLPAYISKDYIEIVN